ncbi:hypothetical protein GALL_435600 [mine drainage metagenome]|uniref:Uncharacterized protein n=1 Tax=mine drainage metagenome TaxID=410659 RepID=A0A1J5PT38_9ZZZZ
MMGSGSAPHNVPASGRAGRGMRSLRDAAGDFNRSGDTGPSAVERMSETAIICG